MSICALFILLSSYYKYALMLLVHEHHSKDHGRPGPLMADRRILINLALCHQS